MITRFGSLVLSMGAFLALAAGVASAQPTRSSPLGVAPDGHVFVVNPDSNTVARLEFDAMHQGTLTHEQAVGRYPRTLAVAGAYVFTADQSVGHGVARGTGRSRRAPAGQSRLRLQPVRGGAASGRGDRRHLPGHQRGGRARPRPERGGAHQAAVADRSRHRRLLERRDRLRHALPHGGAQPRRARQRRRPGDRSRSRRCSTSRPTRCTCETQNSGQGVFNLISAIALMPDGAPAEVADQLWVGGEQENSDLEGTLQARAVVRGRGRASAMFPLGRVQAVPGRRQHPQHLQVVVPRRHPFRDLQGRPRQRERRRQGRRRRGEQRHRHRVLGRTATRRLRRRPDVQQLPHLQHAYAGRAATDDGVRGGVVEFGPGGADPDEGVHLRGAALGEERGAVSDGAAVADHHDRRLRPDRHELRGGEHRRRVRRGHLPVDRRRRG